MDKENWYLHVFTEGDSLIAMIKEICDPKVADLYGGYWTRRKDGVLRSTNGAPEHFVSRTYETLAKGISSVKTVFEEENPCSLLQENYRLYREEGLRLF